jgi:hypothetical protein
MMPIVFILVEDGKPSPWENIVPVEKMCLYASEGEMVVCVHFTLSLRIKLN